MKAFTHKYVSIGFLRLPNGSPETENGSKSASATAREIEMGNEDFDANYEFACSLTKNIGPWKANAMLLELKSNVKKNIFTNDFNTSIVFF